MKNITINSIFLCCEVTLHRCFGTLHKISKNIIHMKLEFIKNQLSDEKLKAELNKVVSSVEALIPESEEDFKQLLKFGLYPAEECIPFVTKQGTPFYSLDNMSVLPLKEQGK
mgnify:CR=1 FL=1